jgi:hypothetical protein
MQWRIVIELAGGVAEAIHRAAARRSWRSRRPAAALTLTKAAAVPATAFGADPVGPAPTLKFVPSKYPADPVWGLVELPQGTQFDPWPPEWDVNQPFEATRRPLSLCDLFPRPSPRFRPPPLLASSTEYLPK